MSSSDQENCVRDNSKAVPDGMVQGRIRRLNDAFRETFMGGQVVITSGVADMGSDALKPILKAVQDHDRFDGTNDPYQEHDFGSFMWGVHRLLWKIDYYDLSMEFGSPDPSDDSVTCRVLTVMLASEY